MVGAILLSNGMRGVGWACLNSGGYAILAQCAPAARRGEASGYYSGVQGSAVILLPALALWLIDAPFAGFHGVFWTSMTLAVVGALISMRLRCAPRASSLVTQSTQTTSWLRQVLTLPDKDVLLAAGLLFGLQISLPTIAGFLVLYARQIGIENFGWYYVASGTTNIIARPLLGWASDKLGRGATIAAGFTLEALALCLIAGASTLAGMMLSGVLYMTGSAMGSAATLAYALDRADQARRGQTMAIYSMAYPSSAFVGSLLAGAVIEITGYFWMFLFAAALNIPGLIVTCKNWSNLK
jgi:MFS family permease